NHQVRAQQFGDEVIDLFFAVDAVVAARRAVSYSDAHLHPADFVPAADVFRRLLRFQIKIDDVLHPGHWRGPTRARHFTGQADSRKRKSRRSNSQPLLLDRTTPRDALLDADGLAFANILFPAFAAAD